MVYALTNCSEFNTSLNGTMTLKCLFIILVTFFSIFLINAYEANECVAPKSSVLVCVNT